MPTDLILISELADAFVTAGIAEAPARPQPGNLPVVWKDPRDGAPDPTPTVAQTITLVRTGQAVSAPYEGFLEVAIVDVIVRAAKSPDGELTQRRVRALLDDHRGFYVGALRVESSYLWRGIQKLGSDSVSYWTSQSFRVACRLNSLAGNPLT